MDRIYIEYLGLAAGTLTTAAYLPQVWKTWRTKAVCDISLVMYTSMFLGVTLWLGYGILIKAPAVIAANSASLLLIGGMLRMKIKYRKRGMHHASGQTDTQAHARRPEAGPTAACPDPGPSLASQLGRSLRQLKDKHHKTWGKR